MKRRKKRREAEDVEECHDLANKRWKSSSIREGVPPRAPPSIES